MRKLAITKNGVPVYDRDFSHLHKGVEKWLKIAISKKRINKNFEIVEYNFPIIIGKTYCVHTTERDTIEYKVRPGRGWKSRFVLGRKPIPTSKITYIVKEISEGYVCLTAFIGSPAPPEPLDRSSLSKDKRGYSVAYAESKKFWDAHALIEE